jgi:flavin-dependent thymidylate synthase
VNSVELVGTYGGDESHALSAWTSTSRDLPEEKRARIPAMLKSLAENGHETPFEKSTLHFLVTCDTASHIHILKHRIGVSVNGESARYKELKEDKYHIPDDFDEEERLALLAHCETALYQYHQVLERLTAKLGRKRAKESARYYLPYANQLQLDVSFNFRSFIHFQRLRNDSHAQREIQMIAQEMLRLVRETGEFKHSLEAFGYGE